MRQELIGHVARCDECSAVVAETARFLDGTTSEGRPALGLRASWVLPLAAALVAALGAAWLVTSRVRTSVQTAESLEPRRTAESLEPRRVLRRPTAKPIESAGPAWLRDAPWNSARRTRMGFGPARAEARAFLVGLHLGALDRACPMAAGSREPAVREVERSLAGGGLLDPRMAAAVSRAAEGACGPRPAASAPATAEWVELGRQLESWRIAVVEKDPTALERRRADDVLALMGAARVHPSARQRAQSLTAVEPAGFDRWDELEADLVGLIEMLCV